MLDRLSAAFDRQERFVAAASHELRTPLTTTRTALEIPLAQGRFPAEVEPDVRRALAANERSEALIATLLALARATRSPAEPADSVDLLDLARRALAEREREAAALSLRAEVLGAPVLARVDAVLASIAVGNLVENAIRHNVERGRLRISGDEEGLLVENDGREMTEAEVSHLVEPFHRGDRTRLAGTGTGLGLTLADAVATALGGRLLLAPRPGGGLTARLLLPRDPRPRDPRPRA